MTTERQQVEYEAGVLEEIAGAFNGDWIMDEDDRKWAVEYILRAAQRLRKYADGITPDGQSIG